MELLGPGMFNILKTIDSYNIDTFPRSLIILGKEGSGKNSLCDYIAQRLNLNLVDISDDLSDELIDNIYRSPQPQIYKIDLRKLPQKKQNIMLKFFEEPPKSAFVIVIANSRFQVLGTVLNRGLIIEIPAYPLNILKLFALNNNIQIEDKDLVLFDTPGELVNLYKNNVNLDAVKDLVDKVVYKMSKASFPNMLTIIDKLNFKDEYDKIDLNAFLKVLYCTYIRTYTETREERFLALSHFVNKAICDIALDSRLNKKLLTSNMLINIWKAVREWS